jgi:hypothetical protein
MEGREAVRDVQPVGDLGSTQRPIRLLDCQVHLPAGRLAKGPQQPRQSRTPTPRRTCMVISITYEYCRNVSGFGQRTDDEASSEVHTRKRGLRWQQNTGDGRTRRREQFQGDRARDAKRLSISWGSSSMDTQRRSTVARLWMASPRREARLDADV